MRLRLVGLLALAMVLLVAVPTVLQCPGLVVPGTNTICNFPLGQRSLAGLLTSSFTVARSESGKVYTIFAGARSDDPEQGGVVIAEGSLGAYLGIVGLPPPTKPTLLDVPFRGGAVGIASVYHNHVELETPDRMSVWLSFVAEQFGQAGPYPPRPDQELRALGYEGVGLGAVRGETLQARSSPVVPGLPYPFVLQTHCGVEGYVDFAGSLWDVYDPAWPPDGDKSARIGYASQWGLMTLTDPDHAVFSYLLGQIGFRRHDGPKFVPLCA